MTQPTVKQPTSTPMPVINQVTESTQYEIPDTSVTESPAFLKPLAPEQRSTKTSDVSTLNDDLMSSDLGTPLDLLCHEELCLFDSLNSRQIGVNILIKKSPTYPCTFRSKLHA